ncbi:hypothetical protein LCGC14_1969210 [marine sediment metagenome]|uniref:Uncharacterized protein n=1 Tax=marine sediment metagenome TaxID=412755 RepID=A0A0F9G0I5_9ZZZZ
MGEKVPISEVKEMAKRHDSRAVIVLYITPEGRVGLTTYGSNRRLCEKAGKFGDEVFDAIVDGTFSLPEGLCNDD